MLDLKSVMVGSSQFSVMAEFYTKIFARPADLLVGKSECGWKVGNTYFLIAEHSEMRGETQEPGRIMCNFETRQIQQEFARIKSLGARVVREPYEIGGLWVATFADPDGNYFQLMTSFEELMGL